MPKICNPSFHLRAVSLSSSFCSPSTRPSMSRWLRVLVFGVGALLAMAVWHPVLAAVLYQQLDKSTQENAPTPFDTVEQHLGRGLKGVITSITVNADVSILPSVWELQIY